MTAPFYCAEPAMDSCRSFLRRDVMAKYKKISQILWLVLFFNALIAGLKIIIALKIKSNSLLADSYHALGDSFTNIIGLVGIKLAGRPADKSHPYGYQKFETIASFIIGIILLLLSIQMIKVTVSKFSDPVLPVFDFWSMLFLGLGFFCNIIISITEYQKGKKYKSEILIADATHTATDILISFGVILTLILIKAGASPLIDPIVSLVIVALIILSCLSIFKDALHILLDKTMIAPEIISEIIYASEKDIIDVHKIRSRGRKDYIFVDLHLILNPEMTIKEAHDLSHRLENILNQKLKKSVELNAHIEPNEK